MTKEPRSKFWCPGAQPAEAATCALLSWQMSLTAEMTPSRGRAEADPSHVKLM